MYCEETPSACGARNMWGTLKHLINPDEFCPECEQFVPRHYDGCPTKSDRKATENVL
jgi:hypothetical protein